MVDRLKWIHRLVREKPPIDGGCRDWPWGANSKGYPSYKWDGRDTKVGHIVLELTGRPRPSADACQLHSCDRPRCVAPWHLRWGTTAENNRDKVARGRSRGTPGETNRQAKLTDGIVRAIRSSSEPYRVLAEKHGVHIKTIAKVRAGKTWAHVGEAV